MQELLIVVGVAPIRSEAKHSAEMVSSLFFGERAKVLQIQKQFIQIETVKDAYVGWVATNQVLILKAPTVIATAKYVMQRELTIQVNHQPMVIPLGSELSFLAFKKWHQENFEIELADEEGISGPLPYNAASIHQLSQLYLQTSYLWGGKSVYGTDCSGFVQTVYKLMGMVLPRDAYQQATVGKEVGFLEEVICGDLAFFDNEEGKIIHVGILLDQKTIIHASGKVQIDDIDHYGIVNRLTKEHTHKLRIIKRIS